MKSTNTPIIVSIIIAVVLIVGAVAIGRNNEEALSGPAGSVAGSQDNVSIVDGKQIIEITAKGGYQPRKSTAKLGMPTILRFNTNGTFDCSSSVRIPSMNISKVLPQTGATDIDIGNAEMATLQGTCSMGMYRFEVEFKG